MYCIIIFTDGAYDSAAADDPGSAYIGIGRAVAYKRIFSGDGNHDAAYCIPDHKMPDEEAVCECNWNISYGTCCMYICNEFPGDDDRTSITGVQ